MSEQRTMSPSTWFWRVALALALVVLVGVAVDRFFGDDGGDDFVEVQSDEHALSVAEALERVETTAFAIRGYVYDDGAFVQLCNGLMFDTDPPRCRGPAFLVRNLDIARLDLTRAQRGGAPVRYTEEPVILGGTVDGTQLSVVEILSTPVEE